MAYTRKHTRKAPVRRTRGGKNPVKFPRGARLGKGAISLNNAIARNAANAATRAAAAEPAGPQPQFNSNGRPIVNLNAVRRQGQANAVQLPSAGPLQLQAPINENAARAAGRASPLRLMNGSVDPVNGWANHGPVARNIKPGVLPSGPTIQVPNAVRNANGNPVNPLTSASSPNYNLNSSFVKVKAEHNFVKSWANSMKTKINGLLAPAAAAAGGARRRSRKH